MKKILGMALAIATLGIGVSAEAKATDVSQQNSTVAASSAPQCSVTATADAMIGVTKIAVAQ